jgi:hypothetical protein
MPRGTRPKKCPFPSGFYEQFAELCPDKKLTSPDLDGRPGAVIEAAGDDLGPHGQAVLYPQGMSAQGTVMFLNMVDAAPAM